MHTNQLHYIILHLNFQVDRSSKIRENVNLCTNSHEQS